MKQFSSVDDYITSQQQAVKPKLELIRQTIQKIVPEAEEIISYGMPAFKLHGMLAYYAAFKNHYSLFVPAVLHRFKDELKVYETSKATWKIPNEKPVPVRLLTKIIKHAAKHNLEKATLREKKKK